MKFYFRPILFLLSFYFFTPFQGDAAMNAGSKNTNPENVKIATVAGGCFWCVQEAFAHIPGVISTQCGYTGGSLENPSYERVSGGGTGHFEAVQIHFDSAKLSYEALLDLFWRNVDLLDGGGQFCDRGDQYRSAIFYHDETQKKQAEASKAALETSGKFKDPIATQLLPASDFYPAEEYHQFYYEKNPVRYKFYRYTCGRDQRLQKLWGDKGRY